MHATMHHHKGDPAWIRESGLKGMGDITQMLISYGQGDRAALDALLPLVYNELRAIARRYLLQERPDHTLQSTGLVLTLAMP